MKLLNRTLMIGVALAFTTTASAVASDDATLVISSTTFDADHDRLCIHGQNFGTPSRSGGPVAAPYVTIDRTPMTGLGASSPQGGGSLSRAVPPGPLPLAGCS